MEPEQSEERRSREMQKNNSTVGEKYDLVNWICLLLSLHTVLSALKELIKEDHGFNEQWYKSSAISRGFELWSPFLIWTSGTPIGLILTPRPKNFLDQKTRENRV